METHEPSEQELGEPNEPSQSEEEQELDEPAKPSKEEQELDEPVKPSEEERKLNENFKPSEEEQEMDNTVKPPVKEHNIENLKLTKTSQPARPKQTFGGYCRVCDEHFRDNPSFGQHMSKHVVKCEVCDHRDTGKNLRYPFIFV